MTAWPGLGSHLPPTTRVSPDPGGIKRRQTSCLVFRLSPASYILPFERPNFDSRRIYTRFTWTTGRRSLGSHALIPRSYSPFSFPEAQRESNGICVPAGLSSVFLALFTRSCVYYKRKALVWLRCDLPLFLLTLVFYLLFPWFGFYFVGKHCICAKMVALAGRYPLMRSWVDRTIFYNNGEEMTPVDSGNQC